MERRQRVVSWLRAKNMPKSKRDIIINCAVAPIELAEVLDCDFFIVGDLVTLTPKGKQAAA